MPEAQNSPPNDRTLSSTAYAQTRRDADDEGHLPAGTMIGDTFKVLSFIGAGGMSNVYKCEDLSIGRIIAVKTLQAGFSKEALRRFQTEGKAIAKLEHPNVLKLYGLQVLPDGLPILVMEFVPGVTLARLLESRQPLTVQRALRIGAQIGEGLKAAEKEGVIHRDLKPSNIMIINPGGIDEQVKILDFGIAKIQDEGPINATRTGEVFGTPQYMSPEQAMGKKCDVRSDQYSFGCVLFEMLTGAPPFTFDNSLSVMMAHVQDAVPSVSKFSKNRIPPHLELAITRLLQKDPARRYATMADALSALFNAKNPGQFNNKFLLLAIAIVSTLMLIAAAYFYYSSNIENQSSKGSEGSSQQQQQQQQQQEKVSDLTKLHSQQIEPSSIDREWMNGWKTYSNQKTIKIPKTQISQSGLKAIANIKGLEALSLEKCKRVDSAGIAELKNLKLRFLNLSGTSIDDHASETIMAIPTLERLYLNDTDVTTNFCEKISISRNLKQLRLGTTKIDGSALAYLANIKSLVDLEISGDDISGKLNELALAHLVSLNLKGVNLSPGDIDAVTKLRDLTTLNVSSTLINDQILLKLAALPNLRTLIAKRCINIHETGIAAFKKAAPNCELILTEEQSYQK